MIADPLEILGDEEEVGGGVMLCGFSIMWVSKARKMAL
jgi:hypothetical protein